MGLRCCPSTVLRSREIRRQPWVDSMAMRVLMLTHFWPPEVGAPQTRLLETAQGLMRLGDDVRVVTNHPHYPDGIVRPGHRSLSVSREFVRGVSTLRLPVVARPNRGFFDRIVDQVSFSTVAAAAVPQARWADVLLVESPPLFLAAAGRLLAAVSQRPYVLHVADPWPDYPIEIGALQGATAIGLARWLERAAYDGAAAITTPSHGCAVMIEAQAVARDKVRVVPNGVDVGRFTTEMSATDAKRRLGWPEDQLMFIYAGTVGLAQGLQTLIDAAAILEQGLGATLSIRIVGGGAEWEALRAESQRRGITMLQFHPAVPAEDIPLMLGAADALLVILKRGRMAEAALPTKLVEALASSRPVIVSADGESAKTIAEADAGWVSSAEDARGLAESIRAAASDAEARGVRGRNARALAERVFDRRGAVESLREILLGAVESRRH